MNRSLMLCFLILSSLAALSTLFFLDTPQQQGKDKEFYQWKQKFGIKFGSPFEESYRKNIFYYNLQKILAHNSNQQVTYKLGVNQFTHLSDQQFRFQYLRSFEKPNKGNALQDIFLAPINVDIDWVQKGAVNPPKNQGQCGACWAFSCIGGLEGLYKITTGVLKTFSEQQLIDCTSRYGNKGCSGGYTAYGYKYAIQNGLCSQKQYPYQGATQACKNITSCSNPWKISSSQTVSGCNNLINALLSRPISTDVDASNWSHYKSGIFNNCSSMINHSVLLVGIQNGVWKAKNSWGTTWGESGYIRLAAGNTCGICQSGSYPVK